MPITLLYDFEETSEQIILKVNLKGATRSSLSITVSDCYLKVNCPPHHFLELDLKDNIVLDEYANNFKSEGHNIVFVLKKQEKKEWGNAVLKATDQITKEMIETRRKESIERLSKMEATQREERKKQKTKEEQRLLELHWQEDKKKREEIERKKNEEKEQAALELRLLKEAKDKVTSPPPEPLPTTSPVPTQPKTVTSSRQVTIEDITNDEDVAVDVCKQSSKYEQFTAPIRQTETSTIKLSFTPRALRTPAREDKDGETLKKYEIWRRKNKPAELEESVVWVIERGDKFMKKNNFSSAISAYSEALQMEPSAITCYPKRAECFLERKEFLKAIEDCTLFLNSESKQNAQIDDQFIVQSLLTRSKCFEEISEVRKALEDAKLAYKIGLPNIDLQKRIHDLEKALSERKEDKDRADCLKEKGDNKYFEQQLEEAIKLYTDAINHRAFFFKAYSNRSMCYLQLKRYCECIQDCTFILQNIHSKSVPESEKKNSASFILKSYLRRGTCHFQVGDYQSSYKDYEQASRMAPEDEDILTDLEKVNQELTSKLQADWLKNTANNFYLRGDYASAILSYTLAIDHDKTNPVYYSNRAQCYFKMGDFVKTVRDCNTALSVLSDADEEIVNRILEEEKNIDPESKKEKEEFPTNPKLTPKLQLKLYLKRAVAYKEMEEYERAFLDIRRAQQFEPHNREIKAEFDSIEKYYKSTCPPPLLTK